MMTVLKGKLWGTTLKESAELRTCSRKKILLKSQIPAKDKILVKSLFSASTEAAYLVSSLP